MKIYSKLREDEICLVDLETVPLPQRVDYETRNENISKQEKLCPHCDGTGNEFMYMYHKCSDCYGTGIRREIGE